METWKKCQVSDDMRQFCFHVIHGGKTEDENGCRAGWCSKYLKSKKSVTGKNSQTTNFMSLKNKCMFSALPSKSKLTDRTTLKEKIFQNKRARFSFSMLSKTLEAERAHQLRCTRS